MPFILGFPISPYSRIDDCSGLHARCKPSSWAALTFLGMLLVTTSASAALAQPYTPQDDNVVLQRIPSGIDPRVRVFDALRAQSLAQPNNLQIAEKLSRVYIDYGRTTGDARYLGRALAVIAPWLQQNSVPTSILLLKATILQSRHLFQDARTILEEVLKADPDNGQAWLTLASVEQVQGNLDKARHACAHLMGSIDTLITAGCIGGLNAVNGHASDGYKVIQLLLAQEPNESPEIRSWAQGLLADAARYGGDDKSADMHYQAALQLTPGDNFLLADYGDFLLDLNKPRAVIDLLENYRQSDTSFLRLVLAEAMLKLPQTDTDIQEMATRFRDLELRGDSQLYAREQARFVLDLRHDPANALLLAQKDWTIQRAPEDARIYLEAALASGTPAAAAPVLEFLEQTHLEYPRVRSLAATVRKAAAGDAATTPQKTSP
jgi:tetratricopeptide (TPR) repeat protein